MADIIEVNITTLAQDIGDMQDTIKMIRDDMKGMFDSINELNTMWDGPAHLAFMMQFNTDKNRFEDLCESLDDVADSFDNAKNEYRKCEGTVSQLIDSM